MNASMQLLSKLNVAVAGSGKTLAFLVPLLLRCKALAKQEGKVGGVQGARGPRALVITPTHELASQQVGVTGAQQHLGGLCMRTDTTLQQHWKICTLHPVMMSIWF